MRWSWKKRSGAPESCAPRRRLAKDRSGTTAVEFALLAFPFFLIVFAILETALIFMGEMTLDLAVEKVGRSVRTGEVAKAAVSEEDFRQRLCAEVDFLLDCSKLKVDLKSYPGFDSIPDGVAIGADGAIDDSGFGYDPGNPETIMALRAYYLWPIYTDMMRNFLSNPVDGFHLLVGMATFRTEPFS